MTIKLTALMRSRLAELARIAYRKPRSYDCGHANVCKATTDKLVRHGYAEYRDRRMSTKQPKRAVWAGTAHITDAGRAALADETQK